MTKTYGKHDFVKLQESGDRAGTSWLIGHRFVLWRDQLARVLAVVGVTPNAITTTGFLSTSAAAACLVLAASHTPYAADGVPTSRWGLIAFALLFVAGACDMLDGAVSRVSGAASRFGQLLDSTLDRFSDTILFLGASIHFAWTGNVTLCGLTVLALIESYSISYLKARADNLIDAGAVGWWQRPERVFGWLVAVAFGHVPAYLWQQATLPALTVAFRLRHARAAIRAEEEGRTLPDGGPMPGICRYIALWRHPRGSLSYDLMAAINIGWIIVAPWVWPFFYGRTDPLRDLLDAIAR